MLEWIRGHHDILQLAVGFCTLLVWAFYFQLLFSGYRRERRPRLVINKGLGTQNLDSPCLICNMSLEPIFIQLIVARLKTSKETFTTSVTDNEDGLDAPVNERTHQGPLSSGSCIEISSFRELIRRVAAVADMELDGGMPTDAGTELKSLELHVISTYGPDDRAFGALRSFEFHYREGNVFSLKPETLDTDYKTSYRYRRQVLQWFRDYA